MKLTALEPHFLTIEVPGKLHRTDCTDVAKVHGVMFLCPKCFTANGGAVGTHSVICWFRGRGVPDTEAPLPGRWAVAGTGLQDLSLSPSILLTGDTKCGPVNGDVSGWHGFITNGEVSII